MWLLCGGHGARDLGRLAFLLSVVGSAPCRLLQGQTRLLQAQRDLVSLWVGESTPLGCTCLPSSLNI